jgi:molybdenum cofactor synthesis domain-containing protein
MRAAVLTVSTSVAAGTGQDRSGPILSALLADSGAEIVARDVVADDASGVAAWLAAQVRAGVELVMTTGGTGFTPDDVTPEATRAVIEREAPGIAEAMRAEALRHTPMGMLSRGVAGIAGRTLIVNFPGSPRAISELYGVVAPVLEHAVATLHREPGEPTAGH